MPFPSAPSGSLTPESVRTPDDKHLDQQQLLRDLQRCRRDRDDALRALRDMQFELASQQALTKVGTWRRGVDSEELYWSDQTYHIHGLPVGMPLTRTGIRELVHEDDIDQVRSALEAAIADMAPFRVVYRIRRPDGAVRVLHSDNVIYPDPVSGKVFLYGAVQDITEPESHPEVIPFAGAGYPPDCLMTDLDGVIQRASGSMRLLLTDLDPGTSIFQLVRSGAPHDTLESALDRVEQTGRAERLQLGLESILFGSASDFEIAPWQEEDTLRGFLVTPLASAPEKPDVELPMSDLSAAVTRAAGAWQFDPASGATIWSRGMFDILDLGTATEPPTREEFVSMVHPDDLVPYLDSTSKFWADRQAVSFSFRIITAKGRTKVVAARMENMIGPDGPAFAFGTLTDLTDTMRLDESSREQTLQVRSLQGTLEEMNHRLLEANLRLSKAQEEERGRIAVDLHDHAGGLLTQLGLKIALMESEGTLTHLREVRGLLEELGNQIRRTTRQLRPNALNRFGIEAALRELAEDMSTLGGLELRFESHPLTFRMDSRTATGVFRIAREAILNVVRHAQASTLMIRFGPVDDHVLLVIEDDGVGFDVEAARSKFSMGLESMFDRADSQGSHLNIRPRTGGGTYVELQVLKI